MNRLRAVFVVYRSGLVGLYWKLYKHTVSSMKVRVVELLRFGIPRPRDEVRAAVPIVGELSMAKALTYESPTILNLLVPTGYGEGRTGIVTPLLHPSLGGFSATGMTIRGVQRVTRAGVMGEYSQAWWIRWSDASEPYSHYHQHPESARMLYDPPMQAPPRPLEA